MADFTHSPQRKTSNIKKWLFPIVGVAAVAIIAFVTVSLITQPRSSPNGTGNDGASKERTTEVNGYTLRYSNAWHPLNIGKEDRADGVVMKLAQKEPQASFIWRILAGEVSKDVKVSDLPKEIEATLKKEVKGFKLVNSGMTKVGAFDAAQIHYKQNGSGDKADKVYENKMYIVPRTKNTYYMIIGAKDGELTQVEPKANDLIESIKGYIESHP